MALVRVTQKNPLDKSKWQPNPCLKSSVVLKICACPFFKNCSHVLISKKTQNCSCVFSLPKKFLSGVFSAKKKIYSNFLFSSLSYLYGNLSFPWNTLFLFLIPVDIWKVHIYGSLRDSLKDATLCPIW